MKLFTEDSLPTALALSRDGTAVGHVHPLSSLFSSWSLILIFCIYTRTYVSCWRLAEYWKSRSLVKVKGYCRIFANVSSPILVQFWLLLICCGHVVGQTLIKAEVFSCRRLSYCLIASEDDANSRRTAARGRLIGAGMAARAATGDLIC